MHMKENDLQDFNFDEYEKGVSLYKSHLAAIDDLKKRKESVERVPGLFLGVFCLFVFIGVAFVGAFLLNWLDSTAVSLVGIPLFFLFLYGGIWCAVQTYGLLLNPATFGKSDLLKRQIEGVEVLRKASYSRLSALERPVREYFEAGLRDFFETNLYKKRSGSPQFEDALSQFSSMLKEAFAVSRKLITTGISVRDYEDYVSKRRLGQTSDSSKAGVNVGPIRNFSTRLSEASERQSEEFVAPERRYRTARKIDNWDEINRKRKMTGLRGEEVVVVIEQEFLESIGRRDLAQRVRHVSVEDGDGLGYDVLSFFGDGREKYVEVKSTTSSISSPFFLSRNELGFLREHKEDSFIYRVLVSEGVPQIVSYSGLEILERNELIPVQYMVRGK